MGAIWIMLNKFASFYFIDCALIILVFIISMSNHEKNKYHFISYRSALLIFLVISFLVSYLIPWLAVFIMIFCFGWIVLDKSIRFKGSDVIYIKSRSKIIFSILFCLFMILYTLYVCFLSG